MKILALDQATKTGWAHDNGLRTYCGVWNLSSKSNGQRLRKLLDWLEFVKKLHGVDLVACESFGNLHGHAKLVLPALRGIVELWCHDNQVPVKVYTPTEIKKHAIGKAGKKINKEVMYNAACRRWPSLEIKDDNVADALWILDLAMKETT